MAATTPHVWYTNFGNGSSTGYYAVTKWVAGATNAAGALIRQNITPAVGSERVFVCIVAGASANPTEPTWVVTKGAKTPDNTTTWMECTGQPSVNGDVTNTPASSTERSQAVTLGLIIKNNTADHYFIVTTAGTCGAGEPPYSTTTGATTVDSGATWTCIGAVGTFTAWKAPHARYANTQGTSWASPGDTMYFSSIHAETQSTTLTVNSVGITATPTFSSLICIANGGNIPPQSGDVTTGATITTTGSAAITFNTALLLDGITISSAGNLSLATQTPSVMRLRNCQLALSTNSIETITLGTINGGRAILDNVTFSFAGTSNSITTVGNVEWRNTASALVGAASPTTLFNVTGGTLFIEGVDLSGLTSAHRLFSGASAKAVMHACKLPSGLLAPNQGSSAGGGVQCDQINCDTGGNTYQHRRDWYEGAQTVDTSVTHTSGASDGTTSYSWNLVTTAQSTWTIPFECMPIPIWNTTINPSNVTVTLEGAYSGTALPNNDDIWLDVVYLGTSGSTTATYLSGTKANSLATGSPLSASSALWTGPARQNSHAYVLGDQIAVVSGGSVTRVFICTGGGTSAGSTPGAYASATDGTVVTDSGATFRAVVRFQLTAILSAPQPQLVGYITSYVRAAKLSSTFWVDPLVTLS